MELESRRFRQKLYDKLIHESIELNRPMNSEFLPALRAKYADRAIAYKSNTRLSEENITQDLFMFDEDAEKSFEEVTEGPDDIL